jgi:hypothetical protein
MLAARGRGLAPVHEAGGRAASEGGAPSGAVPIQASLTPCRPTTVPTPSASPNQGRSGESDSGAGRLGQRRHQAAAAAAEAAPRAEWLYREVVSQQQACGRGRRRRGGGGGGGGVLAAERSR